MLITAAIRLCKKGINQVYDGRFVSPIHFTGMAVRQGMSREFSTRKDVGKKNFAPVNARQVPDFNRYIYNSSSLSYM